MTPRRQCLLLAASAVLACQPAVSAGQALRLPPRSHDASGGTAIASMLSPLARDAREDEVFRQIASGNVPPFLRTLVEVTDTARVGGTVRRVSYLVTPDYLALGSDADYLLMPMTPLLAQRLADALGCSLPTRRMVDAIYAAAPLKLSPEPIPPGAAMVTVPVFSRHNEIVKAQRAAVLSGFPLGVLVAGHKKDVIISNLIRVGTRAATPSPVVIYGWHMLDGAAIQPAYNGHGDTYADYSHGIRLVHRTVTIDGVPFDIARVLADPDLYVLLSDEGVIPEARYGAAPPRDSPAPGHRADDLRNVRGSSRRTATAIPQRRGATPAGQ